MPNDRPVKVQLFESQHIRSEWDAEAEKLWFSVLDVLAVLTDQPDYKKVRNYWKWLKNKLTAADGKKNLTDVVDNKQILRLIQSILGKRTVQSTA